METYTVKKGDTLSGIAWRFYNDPGKATALAEVNSIINHVRISAGQVLTVPDLSELPQSKTPKNITYTIKAGDTLTKIAKQFYNDASQYSEIAEANGITNPAKISVGQVLTIPDLELSTPATNAATSTEPAGKFDITLEQLKEIMPYSTKANREKYLTPLNKTMNEYKINTRLRQAHFLAQLGHESGSLRYSKEIASGRAYEHGHLKEQLGNTQPGDGTNHFKGRGLIQLTGRANYTSYSKAIGIDLVSNPNQLATNPNLAADVTGWFWNSKNLNQYADKDDILTITKKINGGTNGLADREKFLRQAKAALGDIIKISGKQGALLEH